MTLTSDPVDLRATPLSAHIGAVIRGVDLAQPLTDAAVAQIREQLLRYKVIFFPGQHLDPERHVAIARRFGEPTPAHPVLPGIDGYPEVFEIDYSKAARLRDTYGDVADRYDGLSWHTDVTFVRQPPLGSILNAVVIPPAGGDTLFSNQQAAYEALSRLRDLGWVGALGSVVGLVVALLVVPAGLRLTAAPPKRAGRAPPGS